MGPVRIPRGCPRRGRILLQRPHQSHVRPPHPPRFADENLPAEPGPEDGGGGRRPAAPRVLDFRDRLLRGLLGHCGETLKVYGRHADAIEERFKAFGYVPPVPKEEEPEVVAEKDAGGTTPGFSCLRGASSVLRSSTRRRGRFFDDDEDLCETFSLKNIGLSDACLAALGSEDASESPAKPYKKPESADDGQKVMNKDDAELMPPLKEISGQGTTLEGLIRASKEEYDQLPPYMKALASWEELEEGISKLNSYFNAEKALERTALNQDDIGTVGLGTKGRAYLLILLRLNQLTMETVDGSILYTLRKNDS